MPADPGSTATPGLGQEFFDVADAFTKWCNAAGGINGRKIVVDKLDAKLFNVGQEMIQACQQDFMLVGGGNALDAPGVQPRLNCKLGEIPGYTVSPEATNAGLQVGPTASTPLHYEAGVLRLLADAYPASKQGLGIAGSSLASLTPQGLRAQEAWTRLGYKVTTVQPRPALVDNYNSWMQQFKAAGAKADFEITGTNAQPMLTAINDTGFKPSFLLFGQSVYNNKTVRPPSRSATSRRATSTCRTSRGSLRTSSRPCRRPRRSWTPLSPTLISMRSAPWASTLGCCGHSRRPRAAMT